MRGPALRVRDNGRVSEPIDEFSFLAEQSADAGIDAPLPRGERLSLQLADGRALSALRYLPADSPTASPVVTFLHGAGLNAHTWDTTVLALGLGLVAPQIPAIACGFAIIGALAWRRLLRSRNAIDPANTSRNTTAIQSGWTKNSRS